MAAQPAARPARPGMICRLRASTGAAGLRLAHACFLLLLLTLPWGPHWPFSHFGIVAPPAG
ncbi:MAG TPA: hypothetical protein VHB98_16065, partial [Chloroflexota bacterium]|nr:hypothetical protein [Chloroflexota bacterium]